MPPSKKPHADHAFDLGLAKVRALLDTMAKEADRMLTESLQALDGRDGQHKRVVIRGNLTPGRREEPQDTGGPQPSQQCVSV